MATTTIDGHRRVIVRTSDSDVVVLGVSVFVSLGQRIEEPWIAFGMWRNFRYIPIHSIAHMLGPAKAKALSTFHALTGCATTSACFGNGKKTAWSVWQSPPPPGTYITSAAALLPNPTMEIINTHSPVIQKFVRQLYGVSEEAITTVDGARRSLFFNKGRDFEHMPPGSDALHQQLLRVAYQSGHVWGNTLIKEPQQSRQRNRDGSKHHLILRQLQSTPPLPPFLKYY